MDRVIFFGGVLASELEDDLGTAGMVREEASYIVDITIENDPAAVRGSVLLNCEYRELAGSVSKRRFLS